MVELATAHFLTVNILCDELYVARVDSKSNLESSCKNCSVVLLFTSRTSTDEFV